MNRRTMTAPEINEDMLRPPTVDIQWVADRTCLDVSDDDIVEWINACSIETGQTNMEVAVRIVDENEIADLNRQYRDKSSPTNVLSFDNGALDESGKVLLGDIVICASVVSDEAEKQGKLASAHFAHMLVHGFLHLSGHDHLDELDAKKMEAVEVKILGVIGITDPYIENNG